MSEDPARKQASVVSSLKHTEQQPITFVEDVESNYVSPPCDGEEHKSSRPRLHLPLPPTPLLIPDVIHNVDGDGSVTPSSMPPTPSACAHQHPPPTLITHPPASTTDDRRPLLRTAATTGLLPKNVDEPWASDTSLPRANSIPYVSPPSKVVTRRPSALPLDKENKTSREIPKNNEKRILIVDDNPINIAVLRRMLILYFPILIGNSPDRNILTAQSGKDALRLLTHYEIDLIFMDIEMPGLSGIETTLLIRSHSDAPLDGMAHRILQPNRVATILAITTNSSTSWRTEYQKAGMDGCVGKPIAVRELEQELGRLFRWE
ncbi:hypothetical protein BZG36_00646 [Bifiguratus adelaidae]|uniref:Response regulatory domain-containing protein n=1 Tax=Bifiguratus adelaidae TaxID=1938954 RepID=A0A261Y7D8_9FUNG|nr:hypothetical protein BZG36_00646 [Bifiguratus adelaidae]